MAKYLYGASVNGIQSFIFQTNKLKEIAGASELVEKICTDFFAEKLGTKVEDFVENPKILQSAAGTIKCLFDSKEECQAFAKDFAFQIRKKIIGINLSEAAIKIEGEKPSPDDFDKLEKKLLISRNQNKVWSTPSFMATERARRTGLGGYQYYKDEAFDEGTFQKTQVFKQEGEMKSRLLEKLFQRKDFKWSELPSELQDLKDQGHSWIAVIHADGNGLGHIIRNMNRDINDGDFSSLMKKFSKALDTATAEAAQRAVKRTNLSPKEISPVVIGGDDLTVIVKASKALDFTTAFCEEFENCTKSIFAQIEIDSPEIKTTLANGLTVCAGIAYIKYNYPVHYGLHMAESLVKASKKVSKSFDDTKGDEAKRLPPSSLSFYKIESSFVSSYEEIKKRELTSPHISESFVNGPYFLKEEKGYQTLKDLENTFKAFKSSEAPSAPLRQWLGELYENKTVARQQLERIKQVHPKFVSSLGLSIGESDNEIAKLAGKIYDLHILKSVQPR